MDAGINRQLSGRFGPVATIPLVEDEVLETQEEEEERLHREGSRKPEEEVVC